MLPNVKNAVEEIVKNLSIDDFAFDIDVCGSVYWVWRFHWPDKNEEPDTIIFTVGSDNNIPYLEVVDVMPGTPDAETVKSEIADILPN